MKMTPLILRVLSVWLCAAVVCWYSECYVGCTESQQEAEGPVSSQDIRLQEDSDEEILDHKSEESRVLPSQPQSESDQLIQAEYQKPQEVEEKQYPEASEAAEPATETDLVASKGISQPESEHGQSSENQHPEVLNSQNQDLASILPSPDPLSGSAAGLEDSPNVPNVQDNIPKSASDDAFEVLDSDGPPVDCQEETNLYESDSPPTVLENTANVHTTGTNTQTDPPVSSPPVSSPPDHSTQQLEANVSHILKDQDLSSPVTAEADFNVSVKDPEDIPTFDEWKRKVMEVEKEKTQSVHTSTNGVAHAVKKIQKNFNNYASVECGAKILGANPEAKSTSAILKENMDVYMLNPCSNKIWFIIELCEPIQLKQLDIANFELFSSTPKDFLVSISDRYPTNKWLKLGTFHARDERIVQSFPLDEHLYAKYVKMFTKYIKVELLSNFGSEHFCPLSLIRVFGTSMVEEYEEIADPPERSDDQDDDLDYPPGYASGEDKLSNNLIGSAKDVILNMVNNIAVNVLGGGSDMQGNLSSPEVNITEPSPQPETTTETAPTDVSSAPDPEEEEIQQDTDIPATVAPSSETPVPETTTSETSEPEPPPEEEKLVTPLDKDEEEHISSTITLLDKEDDLDEEEERSAHRERQLEIQMCCTLVPLCSCAPSLQEYLHQQCSALLSIKMKCQTMYGKEIISSNQKPSWHQPVPPSGQPESLHPRSEVHQPHEKEQPSEQEPESRVSPAEPPEPSHETEASIKDSMSQPPQLEPSQTSDLPKPGATELSSAKPTAAVETPPLSSAEPGEMQDVAEEKHIEPSPSFSSSIYLEPSASATVEPLEEKSDTGVSQPEINTPIQTSDGTDEAQVLHPTSSRHGEHHLDPSAVPDSGPATTEEAPPIQDDVTELEPTAGFPDNNLEDIAAELPASPTPVVPPSLPSSPSLSDIYADDGTEQNGNLGKNGNLVHSTSQKESVFMRLNNRIKALEMNMSLSGRYLEQLSQRYRKQMEEMQKAFNKTIIKLQNTSRIAEEQDQRQTESIQSLQGQLENMTQLVLNLSVTVSQLQNEVSDRQSYLLLSLVLSLCLGLLLCVNFCRVARIAPRTEPQPPAAKSYTYCSPERQTSSDETGLKRSASFPLINSEPFQLDTAEGKQRSPRGTDMLHPEDKHSLCAATRKRRRRKMKPMEEVETLKPAFHAFSELCNGGSVCNGVPITTSFTPSTKTLLLPMCGNTVSEGSSEGSSHSDDPSFCGITTACTRICEGHPPAMFRAEKQASRRRRPKPTCPVVNLLPAPRRDNHEPLTISSIHDIMNRKTEQSSGTFGTKVALSGPV